jgi:hypothetical protein
LIIIGKKGTVSLETYSEPKPLIENPYFHEQRQKCLKSLSDDMIDNPIITIVNDFNKIPYCFTLQSCYGHFIYKGQENNYNIEPLPIIDSDEVVEYRIAYIAFCIENSSLGRELFGQLKEITCIDPENIQFCCAEWFWKRQVNSYALQVEPDRFKCEDKAIIDFKEALYIEKTRNLFFRQLMDLLKQ